MNRLKNLQKLLLAAYVAYNAILTTCTIRTQCDVLLTAVTNIMKGQKFIIEPVQ